MNIFKRFKRVEEKINFLCDREYERALEILHKNHKKELEEIEVRHESELKRYTSAKIWAGHHFNDAFSDLNKQHGK